jgi:four helix bundle protein
MKYDEWTASLPEEITQDVLWKVEAYRLALFMSEISWLDMNSFWKDAHTRDLSDQLYRAVTSISANIAEGYSHSTGKNRARYFEYALGSSREARDWYYKAHHILGDDISRHRIKFLTQIIRLLTTMIPQQRSGGTIREEEGIYSVISAESSDSTLYSEIPTP